MSGQAGKVLIVDDEPSIRRALRTTFGTLGFDIAEAVTGEQAIPLLRASRFDAVLLDVNMPGMGGIQTCRRNPPPISATGGPHANGTQPGRRQG